MAETLLPGPGASADAQVDDESSGLTGSIILNQHAWEGPGYLLGQVLGDRYRILDIIGEGGMGVVYLGEHVTLQRPLAVKVLHPELCRDPSIIDRFLQEARAASKIGHPSIVDIIDFGWMHRGSVYFVMEYLEGEDLSSLLRRERQLPWKRARRLTIQIARALAASHRKGVIHRDLKPANCFLTQRDGQDFVKLLDFGIAKMSDPSRYDPPVVTRGGSVFGTPGYMAPEQASGEPADRRTDVYATAACLYEFLTGSPPFVGNNFMQVVSRVLTQDLVPPTTRAPENVPPAVEAILLKALERDPNRRYQTMVEFADAIEALHPDLQPQISPPTSESATDSGTGYRKRQTVVPFRQERRDPVPDPPPFDLAQDEPSSELVLATRPPADPDAPRNPMRDATHRRVSLESRADTLKAASPYQVRSGGTEVARVDFDTGEIDRRTPPPEDVVRRETIRGRPPSARRATEIGPGAPESKRATLDAEALEPEKVEKVRTGQTLLDGELTVEPARSTPVPSSRAAPRRSLRDTMVSEIDSRPFTPPDLSSVASSDGSGVHARADVSASGVESVEQHYSGPSQVMRFDEPVDAARSSRGGRWWIAVPLVAIVSAVGAYAVVSTQTRADGTEAVVEVVPDAAVGDPVAEPEPQDEDAPLAVGVSPQPAPDATPNGPETPEEGAGGEGAEGEGAAGAEAEVDAADPSAVEAGVVEEAVPAVVGPVAGEPDRVKRRAGRTLAGAEIAAGFRSSQKRIAQDCGAHPGQRVRIVAAVSGAGFVISAKPVPGDKRDVARCVAEAVEKSARFAQFRSKSATFRWTYRL